MSGMLDFMPFFIQERLEFLKQLSDSLIEEILKYFKDTCEHVIIGILAYFCLCIVFYFATVYLDINPDCGHIRPVSRVLFVTAHPDDECMFFGPTVIKFAQQKQCQIFLLCLSEGNGEKKGSIRRQELWDACSILGIPDSNITLVKHDLLPDSQSVSWREDIVANFILNFTEALSIDTIITFDNAGVSSHQNHIAIYYAVIALCLEKRLPSNCKAYALESTNILRKYTAFIDLPISYLFSSFWYIASFKERDQIKAAMKAHKSQDVWFRKLYMIFSRYTFMNTLREIEDIDLELDLDLQ